MPVLRRISTSWFDPIARPRIQLVSDSPGIAQFAGGDIIAQHLNYSLVTETSPAAPGEIITLSAAGMGLTNRTRL